MSEFVLREVADTDSAALIDLIGTCFAEYPGCVLDVDGEEPWLRAPATAYRAMNGALWVYTRGARGPVVACGAIKYGDGECAEVKSVYVAPAARRRGFARALCQLIEDAARAAGKTGVHLWTDTRFTDAHEMYRRLGYLMLAQTRELHDLSDTVEYHMTKHLRRVDRRVS